MLRGEFLLAAQLETGTLQQWVEAGWLLPRPDGACEEFSEVDLARAGLIRDLHGLGVNEDAMPIVLDLIDQLHGVRRALRTLLLVAQRKTSPVRQNGG